MSTRLTEFTRYMNDFGARAFDQLAAGRAMAAGAEAIPPEVSPLDGLAAHWSALTPAEKARFVKQSTGPLLRTRPRRKSRAAARPSPLVPASDPPPAVKTKGRAPENDPLADKKRKKAAKKAEKKAKKEAKARAKEEKKLRKKAGKETKAREKRAKKATGKTPAKPKKTAAPPTTPPA